MSAWTAIKEKTEVNFDNRTRFEIATEWFYALQDPNISIEKIQEWQKWLAESPENARQYERVEEVLNLSGDTEGLAWPDDMELLSDDYDGSEKILPWKQANKRRLSNPFHRMSLRNLIHWKAKQLSAITVVIAALFSIALFNLADFSGSTEFEVSVYESTTGENKDITLSDGSVITLGAQSLVSVAFSNERRQIVLERGEAFFDVAKNPKRPFSVVTGNRVVTAIGTQFNISKQHNRVVVTVAEGKISLTPESEKVEPDKVKNAYLVAGQRVSYTASNVSEIVTTSSKAPLSWRNGKLQYMEEKLVYVVEDINRYSSIKIRFADEKTKALLYSGTVFTSSLDDWISVLPNAFPVNVSYVSESEVILSRSET